MADPLPSQPTTDLSPIPAPPPLTHLLTLTPATPTRAWQTQPHPTLPLLATCHADRTVRIYNLSSTPTSSSPTSINPSPNPPTDESTNATKTNNSSAAAGRTISGTLFSTISGGHKRSIRTCAWKPCLNPQTTELVLVTGSFDASVGVWRSFGLGGSAARKANTREGREGGEFGGDSEQGGNAGEEEQEGDDEEEEWQYALVLEGHDSEIKSVAFTPSGNLLATASRDKSVWIWEEVAEDEWETVAVLQEHEGDVKCVAWGPEEEVLVSASYDGEVRVWREEGGEGEWGCVGVLKVGDGGTVWWVGFEGAGDPVVKGLLVGEKGREEREEGEGGGEKEWLERRRKAGPRLLTASADCLVRVWRRVPPPEREAVRNQYSIIKREGGGEEWVVEGVLPRAHTREVYAVGWGEGGRVVSGGGGWGGGGL